MQQLRIVLPGARCNLSCKYCLDGYGLGPHNRTGERLPTISTIGGKSGSMRSSAGTHDRAGEQFPTIDTIGGEFGRVFRNAETHHRAGEKFSSIYNSGRLLEAVKPFAFKHIGIWGGEPLFNRHLKPLLRTLRSEYPHASIGLLSNGTLLNKEWVRFFNELDIGLTISHDGPAQSMCRCRDYLTPDYVKLLFELRRFNGTNSVLHRFNCDPWEIYRFFKQKGLPEDAQVFFEPFKLVDYRFADYLPGPSEYRTYYKGWRAVLSTAKAGEVRLRSELRKAVNKLKGRGRTSCGADGRLTVDLAGNIYHCQVAAETGHEGKADNSLPYWCESCRHALRCRGICPLVHGIYRRKMCMLYHLYFDAAEEELGNG